jgi:hypothetical protein
MKFGIIAAVLVVLGTLLVLDHFFSPSVIDAMPDGLVIPLLNYMIFIGPPSALIVSILGLIFDKKKWLASLTLSLSIIWIVFVLWIMGFLANPPLLR